MTLIKIIISILIIISLFYVLAKMYLKKFYAVTGLVALVSHLFLGLLLTRITPYAWDIHKFDRAGLSLLNGRFPEASTTVSAFGTFQGVLYAIFAPDPVVISVFNSLFAILLPIPLLYLSNQLYRSKSGSNNGATLLILFSPLPFFFLTIPMRDALSVLLCFILLSLIARLVLEYNIQLFLPISPLWCVMYILRPELSLIILLGGLSAIMTQVIRRLDKDVTLSAVASVLAGVSALGFLFFANLLYSFNRINTELSYRSQGGAVYLDSMQYTSWSDFLLTAPARAIYFQFTPFPLHVESMFHFLGLISTMIGILLFVSAARSLYESEYNETVAVLLVVVYLAGITGYGVINSNFGTNVRHRIVFDFLLIVMAAPVIQRWELLVREWLGVAPRQRGEDHEQQCEAQKLDGHVHAGRQHANQTE